MHFCVNSTSAWWFVWRFCYFRNVLLFSTHLMCTRHSISERLFMVSARFCEINLFCNVTWCDTPFRVHFRCGWKWMGSIPMWEWHPPPPPPFRTLVMYSCFVEMSDVIALYCTSYMTLMYMGICSGMLFCACDNQYVPRKNRTSCKFRACFEWDHWVEINERIDNIVTLQD